MRGLGPRAVPNEDAVTAVQRAGVVDRAVTVEVEPRPTLHFVRGRGDLGGNPRVSLSVHQRRFAACVRPQKRRNASLALPNVADVHDLPSLAYQ